MTKEWTAFDQKAYEFINKIEHMYGYGFSGSTRDDLHYKLVDMMQEAFEKGRKAGPGLPSEPLDQITYALK